MDQAPVLVSALLAGAVGFLLLMAAASMLALFKGASELRHFLRSNSTDYSQVLLGSPMVYGVSVLAVVRDAAPPTRERIRRLLALHCPQHELVLVLEGLSDAARDQWVEDFHLTPVKLEATGGGPAPARYVSSEPAHLTVVEKAREKQNDPYNAALTAARYPVLALVDARVEFIPDLLLHLMRPLLEDWEHVAAVCASALPPPSQGLAARIGALEMLRRWLVRGAAFASWGKLMPIPGSCVLVKRSAVDAAGGFGRGVRQLFRQIYRTKQKLVFLPAPVSWSRAPGSFADLRDHLRYDQAQLAGGPILFSVRLLRPLIESSALLLAAASLYLGWIHPGLAALVLLASVGTGIALSVAAVVLRELADPGTRDPGYVTRLFLTAIPENLGYRQLRNLFLIAGFLRG